VEVTRAARRGWIAAAALVAMVSTAAAEEPDVAHQPSPCTVPGKPISLCASVTDDGQVAKARIYFRPAGEKFYSFVDMAFTGINFCGTLPAPRDVKTRAVDYYVQGVDDQYETRRTSTYQLNVQPEGICEFPPIEKDASRAAAITVYATSPKQGKKLPGGFVTKGVTFVPVKTK
jgi:hypothetical protein